MWHIGPYSRPIRAGCSFWQPVVPGCSQYWEPKRQSIVNQNPSGKFTRKLENEMPITFVDRQLIDSSHKLDAVLTKAASSCCQLMVKNTSSSWHFFLSFFDHDRPIGKYCQWVWLTYWPPSFLEPMHSCSLTMMALSLRKLVLLVLHSKVSLPHLLIHLFYVYQLTLT